MSTTIPDLSELQALLEIANTLRRVVNEVVATGSNLRKASGENLDIRDRVLIGLAIKAYNSFECLTQDASNWRSEAFHHLKTLAETHIYFQWVGIRTDHSRAKLLLGKATKEKINFGKLILNC